MGSWEMCIEPAAKKKDMVTVEQLQYIAVRYRFSGAGNFRHFILSLHVIILYFGTIRSDANIFYGPIFNSIDIL